MQSVTEWRTPDEPPLFPIQNRATRRTADLLVEILSDHGVTTVFGLPGGMISPMHDALLDRPEIRVITARHESGAMFAAAAYARMTGKPAVVLVTSGPGVLNALTGLASAFCDSLPLVVLSGEVPRNLFGRRALQEGSAHHLNIVGMVRSITKLALEVPSPDAAPIMLERSMHTASSGRPGPVLLTLPLDVSSAPIMKPSFSSAVRTDYRAGTPKISAAVRGIAEALATAKRPVLFAGSGVRWGHGPRRLRALAEALQCPVMTTPKGKGVFPESHLLSLGVFGHGGHPSSTRYLESPADVLLAVGTGLSDPATDGWSELLRPTERFIHVDVDALQMGRNYPVSDALVGDADQILTAITDALPAASRPRRRFGLIRHEDTDEAATATEGRITPQRVLWELQQVMPSGTVYTCDIGDHLMFATHYLEIDEPDSFVAMTGLASMGASISAAIGTKLAAPDRSVVAICGDGAFTMLGVAAVATAAREGVNLLVAVLNDERYGMVENGHEQVYGRRPSYPSGPIEIATMARGAGAVARRIDRSKEILELDLSSLLNSGPVVLDIHIDRSTQMPKNKRNESLKRPMRARLD